VSGVVRDSRGQPIGGAVIHLEAKDENLSLQVQADARGGYSFAALHEALYTLRAEMAGYAEFTLPPFFLGAQESRDIDVTLVAKIPSSKSAPSKSVSSKSVSVGAPEFFDHPQFTVAGVKDTTNLGGHGSDTVVRTQAELARETVSLSATGTNSSVATGVPAPSAKREKHLREEVERTPGNFDANHRLGEELVEEGRARDAIPYLERAAALNPADYGSAYDLARANAEVSNYDRARQNVQELLVHRETAELHHLLADIEEKIGDSLAAVHEYQWAAELDPREAYLFDWGSELLLHRAPEPALEVFTQGNRLYRGSERMLMGLGAAWFAGGSYEQAVQRICEASDLDPGDPAPYRFLGRMQSAETSSSNRLMEKFRRFVTLQPQNAEANFYYAMSLWKLRKSPADTRTLSEIETLLHRTVELDPRFAAAHLQLGILGTEQKDYLKAILEFELAIREEPQMDEAHYRLAHAYRLNGDEDKAKAEFNIYEAMSKEAAERQDRERHEIRQFVYTLRDQPRPQTP